MEEIKNSKRSSNPCPTATSLDPTGTGYYFPIFCVFKKTTYEWKEFARATRR